MQIHTDGSAYKNPGHISGCAAFARYPEHLNREDELIVDFGCPKSTNQRMELLPCVEGLKWVRSNAPWPGVTCVLVITDSKYVQRFIGLAPIWKKSGWRNRQGQPIANHDLWDDLLKARAKAGIRIEFVWQKGKKTEIAIRVDKAAKAATQRGGNQVDRGYKPGAFGRSKVKDRISFNIFVEGAQTFRDKFYAFTTAIIGAEVHRNHAHRVRFNAERGYPQMLECLEEVPIPRPTRKRKAS